MSALEAESLAAIALALAPDWVVAVTPPHGQLTILPRGYVRRDHRCHVADGRARLISRLHF